jgi:hypothetical protein
MSFIFPEYPIAQRATGEAAQLWDFVRKKWVAHTPEEWVRQHLLHWLVRERGIAATHIGVEKEIRYHALRKRFDAVVFDAEGKPMILCECKAPSVALSEAVLHQIARYNTVLNAPFLLLTNGVALQLFGLQADGTYAQVSSSE